MKSPESRSAILAWLVKGALLWQQLGTIPVSSAVHRSTQEYREENDPIKDFLEDHCRFRPQAVVTSAQLRKAYEKWCDEQGVRYPLSPKAFGARLKARGCTNEKSFGSRGWERTRTRSEILLRDD